MLKLGLLLLELTLSSTVTVAPIGKSEAQVAESGSIELLLLTRNDRGVVRCALFGDDDEWLGQARMHGTTRIRAKLASCRFDGVPPGTYAVVAYHDENENAELDKNLVGIPKEGYAASRDAHRVLGAPSYADARFRYDGGRVRLRAKMSYLSF